MSGNSGGQGQAYPFCALAGGRGKITHKRGLLPREGRLLG